MNPELLANGYVIPMICLGALLGGTAMAWWVILRQGRQLTEAREACERFEAAYEAAADRLELTPPADNDDLPAGNRLSREFGKAPIFKIYLRGRAALLQQLQCLPAGGVTGPGKLPTARWRLVLGELGRGMNEQILQLQQGLLLAVITLMAGPCFGLAGMVWGLMATLAHAHPAGLASVLASPVVGLLLLANLAGLAVTLPAWRACKPAILTVMELSKEVRVFARRFVAEMESQYVEEEVSLTLLPGRPVAEARMDMMEH